MTVSLTMESLVDAGVLLPSTDDGVSLAPAFRKTIDDYRNQSRDELLETLVAHFTEPRVLTSLIFAEPEGEEFAARLCALADRIDDRSLPALVTGSLVVDQFVEESLPDEGVPEGFVPISGRRLEFVKVVFSRAVVYVWQRDCTPCDAMRETLKMRESQFPAETARFAVYGPACARYLHEEYDVQGGPATLFFANGRLESRLYGSHYKEVLKAELESLGGNTTQGEEEPLGDHRDISR